MADTDSLDTNLIFAKLALHVYIDAIKKRTFWFVRSLQYLKVQIYVQ